MPLLTAKQDDLIRVILFRARYKSLKGEVLDDEVRFAEAIMDTADHKIDLDEYPEIVEQWLNEHENR